MFIAKCPECSKSVSHTAEFCPYCGFTTNNHIHNSAEVEESNASEQNSATNVSEPQNSQFNINSHNTATILSTNLQQNQQPIYNQEISTFQTVIDQILHKLSLIEKKYPSIQAIEEIDIAVPTKLKQIKLELRAFSYEIKQLDLEGAPIDFIEAFSTLAATIGGLAWVVENRPEWDQKNSVNSKDIKPDNRSAINDDIIQQRIMIKQNFGTVLLQTVMKIHFDYGNFEKVVVNYGLNPDKYGD